MIFKFLDSWLVHDTQNHCFFFFFLIVKDINYTTPWFLSPTYTRMFQFFFIYQPIHVFFSSFAVDKKIYWPRSKTIKYIFFYVVKNEFTVEQYDLIYILPSDELFWVSLESKFHFKCIVFSWNSSGISVFRKLLYSIGGKERGMDGWMRRGTKREWGSGPVDNRPPVVSRNRTSRLCPDQFRQWSNSPDCPVSSMRYDIYIKRLSDILSITTTTTTIISILTAWMIISTI